MIKGIKKEKTTSETCNLCGKSRKLIPVGQTRICSNCQDFVDLLKNSPETIHLLSQLTEGEIFSCMQAKPVEQELPEVLDGVRYRTTDREQNTWYVSVSELEGNPVEIFASTAFDRDQHLQSRISNLTTITRLISLILRHIFMGEPLTLEKTTTQLKRSSRLPNDLPDMLGKVLANYSRKTLAANDQDVFLP